MRDEKIQELVNTYNIPAASAALCVNELGEVSQEKLAVATSVVAGMTDGLPPQNQVEVDRLRVELMAAKEQSKSPGSDRMALARHMLMPRTGFTAWVGGHSK